VERRLNVALLGPRGVGKTSLLRRLQLAMRDAQKPAAFVDATAAGDAMPRAVIADDVLDPLIGFYDETDRSLRFTLAALQSAADRRPRLALGAGR
jgi:GTPase SAR1 family protein